VRLNSDGSQQASFVIGVAGNEIAVRAIAIATEQTGDFAVGISSEGGICSNETILTSN
jgi:hypothetical protein